ncbi:hypothetical protein U3A55_00955 [Salarchaeum sp. III]|uniref:hypothetical protein n=1 Tax=Salarchaeum sp. III TaxID=3107927 RepID=UPI002ED99479
MRLHISTFVVALLVLTAGCTFNPSEPTADQWDRTPDHSLTEKSIPETPDNLTHKNVVAFAKQVEEAYKWNRELTNQTIELSVGVVEEELVNTTDAGYIVRLELEAKKTYIEDGNRLASDDFYTTYYFINDSSIYRIRSDGNESVPDPRNGEHIRE